MTNDPLSHFNQHLVRMTSPEGQLAWWIVDSGRLRKISSGESLRLYRAKFPVVDALDPALASSWKRGALAPTDPDLSFDEDIGSSLPAGRMREMVCSSVRGSGIEFGAGGRPMITPLGTHVRYADRFTEEEMALYSSSRHGVGLGSFMPIDLIDTLEEMRSIENVSTDFIIASHVIEHVANPIQAIVNSFKRLTAGGRLVLMVPDKERTHDRNRVLTPLSHILADYLRPSRDRDLENYIERYSVVENMPLERTDEFIKAWEERRDVHLHVFNYQHFLNLLDLCRHWAPFRAVWSHPGILDDGSSKEMYFVMIK